MGWFMTLVLHGFTTLEIAMGCAVVIHLNQFQEMMSNK